MNWKINILVVLLGICAIALLVTFLKPKPLPDNKYLDLLLKEKDERIAEEKKYREETEIRYNELLSISRQKDSILAQKSKVNTIRYEAIPVAVNAIPDNELKGAVLERYNHLLAQ